MLWNRIKLKLATKYPNLDERVDLLRQVPAVKDRTSGRMWSDREVFEALIVSILSNATDWAKVETVRNEIGPVFQQFDIAWYASITKTHVQNVLIPWFQNRKAGGLPLDNRFGRNAKNFRDVFLTFDLHMTIPRDLLTSVRAQHLEFFRGLRARCAQSPGRTLGFFSPTARV